MITFISIFRFGKYDLEMKRTGFFIFLNQLNKSDNGEFIPDMNIKL